MPLGAVPPRIPIPITPTLAPQQALPANAQVLEAVRQMLGPQVAAGPQIATAGATPLPAFSPSTIAEMTGPRQLGAGFSRGRALSGAVESGAARPMGAFAPSSAALERVPLGFTNNTGQMALGAGRTRGIMTPLAQTLGSGPEIQALAAQAGGGGGAAGGAGGFTASQAAAARAAQAAAGTVATGPAIPMGAGAATAGGAAGAGGAASTAANAAGAAGAAAGWTPAAGGIPMGMGAAEALGGAAGMTGLAGFLQGNAANPTWLTAKLAGGDTAGLGLRSMAKGSLGRAGLYAGTSIAAGKLFEHAIGGSKDGVWDDAIRNAITGTGIGASIGSVVPVIGTGVGAVAGGTIGAIHGALTGKDSSDTELKRAAQSSVDDLKEMYDKFDVSPELREQYNMQMQIGLTQAGSKSDIKALSQQLIANLATEIPLDKEAAKEKRKKEALVASMQAWMGPMMQQLIGQQSFYSQNQADIMNELARQYQTPALQTSAKALASLGPAADTQSMMAMLGQIATTPQLFGYTAQGPVFGPQAQIGDITNAAPTDQLAALMNQAATSAA